MEPNIRISWNDVVEEARKRRKTQGLSQARLAAIAGVTQPTVSRFERFESDIRLSSVLQILRVLGMAD